MKLGTLLLRNAAISLGQLEAALRAQVLYGGRLGTNLVELGFVDVDTLATYIGDLNQLPVATQELLEGVAPEVLALVDPDLADLHGAIPLGFLPAFPDALAVAVVDPRDDIALEQLAAATGRAIAPHVVCELRALYYLERHYGIQRKARFIRPGTRRILQSAEDRRRSQPAGGLVMPPALRLEPRRRGRQSVPPPYEAIKVTYRAACDRIDAASHRDQIAGALLDFAHGRFEALVVLLIRDGNALGWRGHVATARGVTMPLEELSLPLGGTSALETAHDALRPFRGPPPSAGHPVENRLWLALGVEVPPAEVVVAPIVVKQRVVNLVYAHPATDPAADELAELALRASAAYIRLIRAAKSATP